MHGIQQFTAVISPPRAAILAVGAATRKHVLRGDQVTVGTTMALTLSIDHRVLDGATGAAFLADLKTLIEDPMRIVL
jgi:pyruvate dehydrogenase E2 component (dihydrolipoamide acetyltransferase)